MDKCCGDCKHWHPCKVQDYTLMMGRCDKIKKGTFARYIDLNKIEHTYTFDGLIFEDECYDEDLHCFEEGR